MLPELALRIEVLPTYRTHMLSHVVYLPLTRHQDRNLTEAQVCRSDLSIKHHNLMREQVICHQQGAPVWLGEGVNLGCVQKYTGKAGRYQKARTRTG